MKNSEVKKNVVIYSRAATDNVLSVEKQKEELYSHCLSEGYNILEYITDTGSGVDKLRFENMLKRFVELKPDYIIATSIDRLSREYNQLRKLLAVCNVKGIKISVLAPQMTTPDENEKFDFFLSLLFAATNNSKKSKKVKANLKQKK